MLFPIEKLCVLDFPLSKFGATLNGLELMNPPIDILKLLELFWSVSFVVAVSLLSFIEAFISNLFEF